MLEKGHIRWLYGELPELVRSGVVTGDGAERLRDHYGAADGLGARNMATIALGILGSGLIGLGIILILAFNWNQMDRPLRAVIAMVPLLFAQILGGYALLRKKDSRPWHESAALFQSLAIGAAIALIGQTYQFPGNLGSFLMTWCLLTIPMIYIFRANFTACLYLVGAVWWAIFEQTISHNPAMFFWVLAGALAPYYVYVLWKSKRGVGAIGLSWTFVAAVSIALGVTADSEYSKLWIILYTTWFAFLYLAGACWFDEDSSVRFMPFRIVGFWGAAIMSLMLTFPMHWWGSRWNPPSESFRYWAWETMPNKIIILALLGGLITVMILNARRHERSILLWGAGPLLAAAVLLWAFVSNARDDMYPSVTGSTAIMGMFLFNLYMAALGIERMIAGVRRNRMSSLNAGLALLGLLITARFLDSDLGFVERGVGFIMVGTAFLMVNYGASRWMAKKNAPVTEGETA